MPWIFVYRDPVEILVSQFKQNSRSPPCARGRGQNNEALGLEPGASSIDYCAAKLGSYASAMLSLSSAKATDSGADFGAGLMVDYKDLPGALIDTVLAKHFPYGVRTPETLIKMNKQGTKYSKDRMRNLGEFASDSGEKQSRATAEVGSNNFDGNTAAPNFECSVKFLGAYQGSSLIFRMPPEDPTVLDGGII